MKISNKINGMENAQTAPRAKKKEKEKREDKRKKSGKEEKLFEMNLKLCVIHNHEARDS